MGWKIWTSDKEKGSEPPLPPSHPLLDHKAWVTSDEATVRLFDITNEIVLNPMLTRRTAAICLDDFTAGLATQQWVPATQLLTAKQCDKIYADFTRRTLPKKLLPWLQEQFTVQKFSERMADSLNLNLSIQLEDHDAARFAQALARHLAKAFPRNDRLQEFYAPDAQARMGTDADYQHRFLSLLTNPDILPKGSDKLRLANEMLAVCLELGMVDQYNFCLRHTPFNAGGELGLSKQQVEKIVGFRQEDVPLSGRPLAINIDAKALAEAGQQRIGWARDKLPGEFRASLDEARRQIDELRTTLRTANLDHPAMTDAAARHELDNALMRVPEHSLATRVMRVSLSNPRLHVVVVPGSDANAYWSDFGRKDVKKLEKDSVAGFSEGGHADRIYVSVGTHPFHVLDVTVEELLHNSMKNLYESHQKQQVYPDSIPAKDGFPAIHDTRRTLFLEALTSDLNRIGRNMDIMREDLGLPKPLYRGNDFHSEVIVKILKMKALGHWTAAHSRRYSHLNHYVDKVVTHDIAAWEREQGSGKPFDILSHPIHYDDLHREMPPVLARQEFKQGAPITKQESGGKSYYVLNGDSFAFTQKKDPDELVAMVLPSVPRVHSDTPQPDKITIRDTPEGAFVTVPEELLMALHPRLRDGFERGQKVAVPPPLPPRPPGTGNTASPAMPVAEQEWRILAQGRDAPGRVQDRG